eukprot:274876-Rhodomonas_salina.1
MYPREKDLDVTFSDDEATNNSVPGPAPNIDPATQASALGDQIFFKITSLQPVSSLRNMNQVDSDEIF